MVAPRRHVADRVLARPGPGSSRGGRLGGPPAIRVVLAEDNFLAREGIAALLDRLDGIELVASCSDVDTLRDAIERSGPDVVLTDIRLPPGRSDEGIRLAGELRTTHPGVGVVVLSQSAEPLHATALFADGSYRRAYLLKERLNLEQLARAIREVAGGGAVVDPRVVDELISATNRGEHSPLDALTHRELEIVSLIAEGHSNSAIADRLSITKRGVERHINSIFAKLDLGDSRDVSQRVKAALLFVEAEAGRAGDPQS